MRWCQRHPHQRSIQTRCSIVPSSPSRLCPTSPACVRGARHFFTGPHNKVLRMRKISFERFNENDHRCQARNRRGTRCGAQAIVNKRVCKFHGGKSTGPKTEAGKLKAAENLRLYWQRRKAAEAIAAAAGERGAVRDADCTGRAAKRTLGLLWGDRS